MLVIVKSFLLNIGPPCGKNITLFGWVRTKKSLKFGHLQIQVWTPDVSSFGIQKELKYQHLGNPCMVYLPASSLDMAPKLVNILYIDGLGQSPNLY